MHDRTPTDLGSSTALVTAVGAAYLGVVVGYGVLAGRFPSVEALLSLGDSPAGGLLVRLAGTVGVVLLGAAPVVLYDRAGLVLPALAPVGLLAWLATTSGSESFAVLVFFYTPFFLTGAVALGGVEYAVRRLLVAPAPGSRRAAGRSPALAHRSPSSRSRSAVGPSTTASAASRAVPSAGQ